MRSWSIHLFAPFGIRLDVHVTFFLLLAFIAFVGWSNAGPLGMTWQVGILLLIFVCVVLHELGHSLAARRYGIPVDRILLLPIGGMAQFRQMPRDPWKELVITIAGPAVNFFLAAVLYLGLADPWGFLRPGFDLYSLEGLLQVVFAVNMIMGVFNLLPVFPMDGGRIFRALLAYRMDYLKATFIAATVAKVLAAAGVLLALFVLGNPLLAILFTFIFIGGEMEYQALRRSSPNKRTANWFVGDLTRRSFLTIPAHYNLREALNTLALHRPQDLVVMDHHGCVGVLTKEKLKDALQAGKADQPVTEHIPTKFPLLQANWPVYTVFELLDREEQTIFPVFENGVLIGVIDASHVDESLDWLHLRAKHFPPPGVPEHSRTSPPKLP
ncbi:MAG: site-2 protease family protein [Opitutales bacterium]|nr:site-2 protease family protein [Opitutales bacterium]MCH8539508.1 site-2 protease family protein [Opitutales bacterium]